MEIVVRLYSYVLFTLIIVIMGYSHFLLPSSTSEFSLEFSKDFFEKRKHTDFLLYIKSRFVPTSTINPIKRYTST